MNQVEHAPASVITWVIFLSAINIAGTVLIKLHGTWGVLGLMLSIGANLALVATLWRSFKRQGGVEQQMWSNSVAAAAAVAFLGCVTFGGVRALLNVEPVDLSMVPAAMSCTFLIALIVQLRRLS